MKLLDIPTVRPSRFYLSSPIEAINDYNIQLQPEDRLLVSLDPKNLSNDACNLRARTTTEIYNRREHRGEISGVLGPSPWVGPQAAFTALPSPTRMELSKGTRRFNDSTKQCDVLLTTYACGAVGLNLHKACHSVVLLEPALNINTTLQAIGRIHRLGQRFEQEVRIIFNRHSWDRYIEYNSAKKMVCQLVSDNPEVFSQCLDVINEAIPIPVIDAGSACCGCC
ncbi:hypothetical protein FQN49_000015 [Arthroderma sp. PD_2]|nr:hypothetical protein FQN49_000015 [Arthroderma sp. PD_2]